MALRCDDYDGICVLSVGGDLAGEAVTAARRGAADQIEQRNIVQVVVDLEQTAFVDSAGLEALLWIKRRCEESCGQMKLAGISSNVRKILEMTRLDHQFQTAADVTAALKMMR